MSDLISRQAAIEAIKDFKNGAAEWRDEQEEQSDIWHRADSAVASALEIGLRIKKLPTAQERKTGKWIKMSDGDGIYWACSECGDDIPRIAKFNPQFDLFPRMESIEKTKYCPNCGSDNRGVKDGNE